MAAVDTATLIEAWTRLIDHPAKSLVLFEYGTCVVLTGAADSEDLAARATALLAEAGPVHPGSPAGDFGVIDLGEAGGWVVTGDHPDVLTYVGPAEPGDGSVLAVGVYGRGRRHQDGTGLRVVHVEDRRGAAGPA
ncbi:hypothetical protein [Kitasatospora sp. RG8]|uniref:hypothetical protein n=1 Tax=Kitasatospora sp. RG8 TaxID=2820815 RepID=UPI001FD77B9B|nr:hypothetical protein [Kitasatospora sp. RG8]